MQNEISHFDDLSRGKVLGGSEISIRSREMRNSETDTTPFFILYEKLSVNLTDNIET